MTIVGQFPHQVVEDPDMGIVLPDGCRLSARVWMPVGATANPVPAILEYIPYRKRDGTTPRDEMMHPYLAGHGYACIRVDMRGSGESDGLMLDEYTRTEMDDAAHVIDWLSRQPWCSGAVGMMGKSWGGFNCLQAAFNQPPALKAVIAVCATTDRFADDIHFKGGCLLGENFGWGAVMLSYSSRPADPALRSDWRKEWLMRLQAEPWLAPVWAAHQARDDYWKHGSVGQDYTRMNTPVLVWGGWADNYMNTVDHLLRNVPAQGGAACQGIVGPWVHQYPHTAVPGPQVGFLQASLRWWDRWLKGTPNGAEHDPALRAYMIHSAPPDASAPMRAGHWLAEPDWPSPRVADRLLHLGHDTAGHGTQGHGTQGHGTLADTPTPFTALVNTPQHLGMHTGEFFPMGLNAEMPGDQRSDDALSVCFDTAPLDAELDLLGAPMLHLHLSCDQPLGFVVVRLNDVAPDGSSVRIAHGMLNLCHRNSMDSPAPMVPGQVAEVRVTIDQTAYRIAAGHRLRVALSTTYWPFVWPSPVAATLTVTAGSLTLPVHRGGTINEWDAPPAEHAPPAPLREIRAPRARRVIENDMLAGTHALVVETDEGAFENLSHGLVSDETLTERWEVAPDDPLSARATHLWEQRRSRGEWQVRTRAWAEMTATATHLHMAARLTAWEGDVQVFDRAWDDTVPRHFV